MDMAQSIDPKLKPNLRMSAVCGLFCPGCSVYIGTREDPERLKLIAARWNIPVEEARCDGCRSDRRFVYCQTCQMVTCADERGLEFCGECDEYPCEKLKEFQAEMPHRIDLWDDLSRIKEVGWDKWFAEKVEHHTCPECGAMNSAYDLVCRKCGASPSCEYVRRHQTEILAYMSKMM